MNSYIKEIASKTAAIALLYHVLVVTFYLARFPSYALICLHYGLIGINLVLVWLATTKGSIVNYMSTLGATVLTSVTTCALVLNLNISWRLFIPYWSIVCIYCLAGIVTASYKYIELRRLVSEDMV